MSQLTLGGAAGSFLLGGEDAELCTFALLLWADY